MQYREYVLQTFYAWNEFSAILIWYFGFIFMENKEMIRKNKLIDFKLEFSRPLSKFLRSFFCQDSLDHDCLG